MIAGWLGGVRGRSKGRKPCSFTDSEVTEGTPIVRWLKLFAGLLSEGDLGLRSDSEGTPTFEGSRG